MPRDFVCAAASPSAGSCLPALGLVDVGKGHGSLRASAGQAVRVESQRCGPVAGGGADAHPQRCFRRRSRGGRRRGRLLVRCHLRQDGAHRQHFIQGRKLVDDTVQENLYLYGAFVGFYHGHNVARLDPVTGFDQPLDNLAGLHICT